MEAKGTDSATSNWVQSERLLNCDGGNGDELHGGEGKVNGELGGGYNSKDLVDESTWEVRGEGSENQGSSVVDPLVQSICTLQSAQEALEKELLKFKEVGTSNVSSDVGVNDLPSEVTSLDLKPQATKRKYTEAELEGIFRLKIEAEVEYLAISRTVQWLRMAAVDQIAVLEEKATLASEQARMLNMLENTRNKASLLKKQADKFVKSCKDMGSADEPLMLKSRIYKYTSYFCIQLVMLVSILGFFIIHVSPNYAGVVPT